MKTTIDKTQQEQNTIVQSVQQEPGTGGTATIVDNRPATVYQRKLRAAMNNSPRNQGTAQLRETMNASVAGNPNPIQRKANNTGLPDTLKSGIENLSGYAMDDVKVHYNSSKPAQLQAHAYAQGTDIHLAPGQEKHLPHEAWHVVQQKQGRVKPTKQLKSKVNINDDAGLEKEADVMGAKALSPVKKHNTVTSRPVMHKIVQRRIAIKRGADDINNEDVIRVLFAYLEHEEIPLLFPNGKTVNDKRLTTALNKLRKDKKNLEVFDLNNYQHIGLLWGQIQRQYTPNKLPTMDDIKNLGKSFKPSLNNMGNINIRRGKKNKIEKFDIAFLGRGSSISYYISSLGPTDFSKTAIIGKHNPWAGKRGPGIINHPKEAIAPFGTAPLTSQFNTAAAEAQKHEATQIFQNRYEHAQETTAAIQSAIARGASDIDEELIGIKKTDESEFEVGTGMNYIIETEDGIYAAREVIMGTGGGPHAVPRGIKTFRDDATQDDNLKAKLMDLDTFMNLESDQLEDKRVVVMGSNAGIDAAEKCVQDDAELVLWTGGKPPYLYKSPLAVALGKIGTTRIDRNSEQITADPENNEKLVFSYNINNGPTRKNVGNIDYVVYAIGQDVDLGDGESKTSGPRRFLSAGLQQDLGVARQNDENPRPVVPNLNEEELKGKYDMGGAAAALGTDTATVLKIPGRNFTVIGAAAWRLADNDGRRYLNETAKEGPSNAVGYEQLAPLKRGIAAHNAYIPSYIERDFDWLTANRNEVAHYLTIRGNDTWHGQGTNREQITISFYNAVVLLRRFYPNGIPVSVMEDLKTADNFQNLLARHLEEQIEIMVGIRDLSGKNNGEIRAQLRSDLGAFADLINNNIVKTIRKGRRVSAATWLQRLQDNGTPDTNGTLRGMLKAYSNAAVAVLD